MISNNGAILGGSVETFPAGSFGNAKPSLEVKGNKTFLDLGGASGDAVSSFDGHIVVTSAAASIVLTFGPGTNGNSAPETVLAGPNTGINTPQGATFQNPFQPPNLNIFANSNFLPVVIGPASERESAPRRRLARGSVWERSQSSSRMTTVTHRRSTIRRWWCFLSPLLTPRLQQSADAIPCCLVRWV